jgi:predicted transcriptional regulator
MKRGAIRKNDAVLISVWVPDELVLHLDTLVQQEDSDRSKIIRKAIRARLGQPAALCSFAAIPAWLRAENKHLT